MTTPIRIMIAEDQQLIRRAFAAMLSLEADIDVVAQAADGAEALQMARAYRPDVVLMDLQMPRVNGIAATRRIMQEAPGVQVIILTTFDTDDLVFDAISAGAQAYLLKDADEAEILGTIRAVHRGESRLTPNIARKVLDEFRRVRGPSTGARGADEPADEPLSARETAILDCIVAGKSNKAIAEAVNLAEGTVKNYVSRIMEKLHARNRVELAVKVLRRPLR